MKYLIYSYRQNILDFWQRGGFASYDNLSVQDIQMTYQLLESHLNSRHKKQGTKILHFLLGKSNFFCYCRIEAGKLSGLENDIASILGSSKISIENLITIIQSLNTLIDYGNIHGFWSFNLILKVERLPKIVNPIGTDDDWQKAILAQHLSSWFCTYEFLNTKSFTQASNDTQVNQVKIGALTLSLMIESHMLNPRTLSLTLLEMIQHNRLNFFQDQLFVQVYTDSYNPLKKVFISRKTELLFYRLHINSKYLRLPFKPNLLFPFIYQGIAAFLKLNQIPLHRLPKTLINWCRLFQKSAYLKIPPILININSGQLNTHSLNACGSYRVFMAHYETESSSTSFSTTTTQASTTRNTSESLRMIQAIFKVKVGKRSAKTAFDEIQAQTNQLMPMLSPNYQLILEWALSLLQVNKQNRFTVSPLEILNKIYSFARLLVGCAETLEIKQLSTDERGQLYQQVFSLAVSDRNRNTLQYILRRFNSWLEQTYHLPAIQDKEGTFGNPKMTDMTVNANLIHFDEYSAIKSYLIQQTTESPDNRLYPLMLIALILGFRCGLRSKEVFFLKIADFIDCRHSPQLVIRESEERSLKTQNAKRTFVLNQFLEQDEIEILTSWYQQTYQQIKQLQPKKKATSKELESPDLFREGFLLYLTIPSLVPIQISKIKTPLIKIVQHFCQDQSLKFHHLRHSFASWHFLSMVISEFDLEIGKHFDHLPKTKQWLSLAHKRKLRQLPTQLKSKKYGFWLQDKIGHGSFSTTLEHYIHTCDIAMMLYLQKEAPISIQELNKLSGISISTLKKHSERLTYTCSRLVKPHKNIHTLKRSSQSLLECWQTPKKMPFFPEDAVRSWNMFNLMEIYHQLSEQSHKTLSYQSEHFSKDEIITLQKIFMENPKFRVRRPFATEWAELNRILNLFQTHYKIQNMPTNYSPNLLAILNAFSNRLYPLHKGLHSLAPNKGYHLVISDKTSARIIISHLKTLELPFAIKFRHTNKWGQSKIKQGIRYWKRTLELERTFKFSTQVDSEKSLGKNGRIELIVMKQDTSDQKSSRKSHAYYYAMVMLCVYAEFHGAIG